MTKFKTYPIKTKRIYEDPSDDDGVRILVDRLWPRGISKERAKVDSWGREVAPSTELREWFGHKPERFDEFGDKYINELKNKKPQLKEIKKISKKQPVTLVYSAKDTQMNQATVLKETLDKIRD